MLWMYLCILLTLLSSAQGQIVWAEENCNTENSNPDVVYGEPTDAVCCNATRPAGVDITMCANKMDESLCENIEEEMELEECLVKMCEKEDKCIWRQGVCKPNRDLENNVCCPPEHVITNCQHILRGECPLDWRIPRQCCPPPYDKYRQRLDTGEVDTVCCNAPCKAIELAWTGNATRGIQPNETCTADLSTNCGPGKRSALMSGGMNPFLLSQMMGMPTTGGSGSYGQNNQFFGSVDSMLGGQMGMMMGLMGDLGVTETEPVEEITVDDFFDALIVALDNDKDVYEYQSDTYSHPFFGKMSMDGFNPLTGGLLGLMMGQMGQGGFNYPDPYQFINPMTSYNPYGYQAAQYSYSSMFGTPQSSYQQPTDPFDLPGFQGTNKDMNKLYGYNSQSQYPSYNYNYQYPSNNQYTSYGSQGLGSSQASSLSNEPTQSSSTTSGSQAQSGSSSEANAQQSQQSVYQTQQSQYPSYSYNYQYPSYNQYNSYGQGYYQSGYNQGGYYQQPSYAYQGSPQTPSPSNEATQSSSQSGSSQEAISQPSYQGGGNVGANQNQYNQQNQNPYNSYNQYYSDYYSNNGQNNGWGYNNGWY